VISRVRKGERVVVAVGGNALIGKGEKPTLATQFKRASRAMRSLIPLIENRNRLVITHGNGFQVGNILIRVEEALGKAYAIPLDVCVAESQGELGYLIEQSLQNGLTEKGIRLPVVSILTQVIVDPKDPAFKNPTKPVGPFYSRRQAARLEQKGFQVVEQAGRGWRKVVPSPKPLEIDDLGIIDLLLRRNVIVIAGGGGGVPVVRTKRKTLKGVAAVVDKDLASATLACGIGAPHLIILTGERYVYRDYATKKQRPLRRLTIEEARRYLVEGQFPPGSMGPKIEAAIEFLERGGKQVVITAVTSLSQALKGKSGTVLVKGD
jgi:carbamate kinase